MLAHGHDDFNANNFFKLRTKKLEFFNSNNQISPQVKNMIIKKIIMITVR